ncbi:MAG: AzlC family ABC transporter permease, partial [Candidatus Nanopelagicaceae bacterium]
MSSVNRATLSKSLSVSLAVGAYGTAFGAAAVAAGFSVLQACLLSLLTFTGASQFAVIGVIGAGGTALTGIATASLLGFRNAIYSMIAKPILNVSGLKKLWATQITIDESIAVATAEEVRGEAAMRHGFWLTGSGVFLFWNLFTLLGALGAQAIGDPA